MRLKINSVPSTNGFSEREISRSFHIDFIIHHVIQVIFNTLILISTNEKQYTIGRSCWHLLLPAHKLFFPAPGIKNKWWEIFAQLLKIAAVWSNTFPDFTPAGIFMYRGRFFFYLYFFGIECIAFCSPFNYLENSRILTCFKRVRILISWPHITLPHEWSSLKRSLVLFAQAFPVNTTEAFYKITIFLPWISKYSRILTWTTTDKIL